MINVSKTTARAAFCVIAIITVAIAFALPRAWAIIQIPYVFTEIKQLDDGNVQVTYNGPINASYRLWATPDVTASPVQSTWTLLTNSTMPDFTATFTDLRATNFPQRFYIITSP